MTDYTILPTSEEVAQEDLLAIHLAFVPLDVGVVCLISDLFERYKSKGIASRFSLHHFNNQKQDPHGLLVGLSDLIAVFWRASSGHFWLRLDQISFEHPAAFLTGTRAPFIDKPRVGTCYRFSKGTLRTLAKPFSPCDAVQVYRNLIKVNPAMLAKHKCTDDDDGNGAPPAQTYRPNDGFSLLGE